MSETQHGVLDRASVTSAARFSADTPKSRLKLAGLLVGTAALVAIVATPQPAGFSLGIFAFAVVMPLVFAATDWCWLGYT